MLKNLQLHMKPLIAFICLVIAIQYSCNGGNSYPEASNAFDAGREFIDGCLKGDFTKAAFYMVPDEQNNKDLLEIKRVYNSKSTDQKREYYTASIIIEEEETVSDSIHIIHYKNSYDKVARKVKIVLLNNTWQVDFKYTFDGNL